MQIYFNVSMIRLLFIDFERFETNQIIAIGFLIETQQSSHKLSFKVNQQNATDLFEEIQEIQFKSISGSTWKYEFQLSNKNMQWKDRNSNGR